jgi:hypothetical protein
MKRKRLELRATDGLTALSGAIRLGVDPSEHVLAPPMQRRCSPPVAA